MPLSRMTRRLPAFDDAPRVLGALTLAALLAMAIAAPAAGTVTLDAERRAHLASLDVIRDAGGELSELDGRPVVVTFFASWCPPCRAEFEHLAELHLRHAGAGLRVVAVNVFEAFDGNDAARLARFLDDTAPPFAVVEGTERTKALFGDVARIPTVFVFTPDGRSVLHFIHARGARKMTATPEELEAAVRLALAPGV